MFATQSKREHAFIRKRVAGVYSMSAMLRYEEYLQPCIDLMMERLKSHAELGHHVNMTDWTSALAFDVVGVLAYGAPLGQLDTETDYMGIREDVGTTFKLLSNLGHCWWVSRILSHPITEKASAMLGMKGIFASLRPWPIKQIENRRQNMDKNEREDMLSHFLNMKSATGEPASNEEVMTEAMSIM